MLTTSVEKARLPPESDPGGGQPMPLPRAITRFNRSFLNRLLAPAARYLPAFGVIVHRGRKTGRAYRTPVNMFKRPDGYVIALTYGVGDWVRNVLAAGEWMFARWGRS